MQRRWKFTFATWCGSFAMKLGEWFVGSDAIPWARDLLGWGALGLGLLAIILTVWAAFDWLKERDWRIRDSLPDAVWWLKPQITWLDKPLALHHVRSVQLNETLVEHFSLLGKSNRKRPIRVVNAYLRSLVTGEVLPAQIERLDAKGCEIQSLGYFRVAIRFPNEEGPRLKNQIQGMAIDAFRQRFSNFVFIFETTNKKHEIVFDTAVTEKWILGIKRMLVPPAGNKAAVLPGSGT